MSCDMEITLYTDKIFRELERLSRQEAAGIQDPDVRYSAEVGTNNREEIYRELTYAVGSLKRVMHRVLKRAVVREVEQKTADNLVFAIPDSIVFELAMSERRAANKVVPLCDKMQEFLVNLILTRHYANVGQGEMSKNRSLRAIEIGNEIDELIYTKEPPQV